MAALDRIPLNATLRLARLKKPAMAWMEYALWAVGCVALGYCAFLWGRAAYNQTLGSWTLDHLVSQREPQAASVSTSQEGRLVGRIEIPRLNLSAIVFEGTSDETLARGVGHLTGSASPGENGNLVLAGHRDSYFRKLRGIRDGDAVTVSGRDREFEYVVESTAVVSPDATEVLRHSNDATLTLITCYPFRYVGSAPQRFVVRAKKVRTS